MTGFINIDMTGFINIDKCIGESSAREVAVIKKLSGMPCGHMGTLDPLASGVLPIGIGNACRLFDYFLTKRKVYRATFRFGSDYDTLDTTGSVIADGGRVPAENEISAVIPTLVGNVMQVPPKYSAKNVCGKRGYQLARAGVDFELAPKAVEIYSIVLLSGRGNEYDFRIECGGGTYIRSVCRDMAQKLDTYAAMSALVREQSGPFTLDKAVKSCNLTAQNISAYIIPTQTVLPFEEISVSGNEQKRLLNGVPVPTVLADGTYKIFLGDGSFYGLGTSQGGCLKVKIKLC